MTTATQLDTPFALYFCNEDAAKVAGEGTKARAAAAKTMKVPQPCLFDSKLIVDAVKKAGMTCVKVPIVAENAELGKKYRIQFDPTLVICAPNGEALAYLAGQNCRQQNLLNLLPGLKGYYSQWKQRQPAK
jgi:hypothetical protein